MSLRLRTRTSQAVRQLLELQPDTARVVRDGEEVAVATAEVAAGALVRIRPGESIPVDGVVREGHSTVDQALVTGEPITAEKVAGDEVVGGSINQAGSLLVEVTRVGEESFLSQVARHVEEARALKPGLLQLVDRILQVYVPTVLAIAGLAFLFWSFGLWLLFGQAQWARALFAALAVGVMGHPCALGMATLLAMIRGGGMAAERGILMRSGEAFQVFGELSFMVLDKAGTITEGKPEVVDVVAPGDADELLRVAAAAEASSSTRWLARSSRPRAGAACRFPRPAAWSAPCSRCSPGRFRHRCPDQLGRRPPAVGQAAELRPQAGLRAAARTAAPRRAAPARTRRRAAGGG